MNKHSHFLNSIRYIEDNLNSDVNLEQAACAGFASLMQLYRDFYAYTGHSVKEYIRKRRLSNALSMIRHSDMSIAEIAYTCGYSSQQALCKYVRAATAMTALAYKDSDTCYYFPMFSGEAIRQITVAAETIPQTICVRFYHNQLRGIENRAINMLFSVLPGYGGRIFGRNGKQSGAKFCYELFVEYDDDVLERLKAGTSCDFGIIPDKTSTFAKTAVKNDDDEIGTAWDYLYISWLRNSMFTQDDGFYFEEYIYRGGFVKKLVLYLPVKKRMDYNRISMSYCESMAFLVSSKRGLNAEEKASEAVMKFLSVHYPGIIKTTRQYYLSKRGMDCTCGIRLEKAFDLPGGEGLEIIDIPEGNYAVLDTGCCSDSCILEPLLLSWITENGLMKDDTDTFTIYETDGGFEPEDIRTKLFIKLKNNVKN